MATEGKGVLSSIFRRQHLKAAPVENPPPFAEARVHTDDTRCVQCGVCGYNCPVGIMVRDYARHGRVVTDPICVQCGQCINVCPRGALRWGSAPLRAGPGAPGPATPTERPA